MSTQDQIKINKTENGICISLDGSSIISAFMSILFNSKFSTELRSDFLLTPYTNKIIKEIIECKNEDNQYNDRLNNGLGDEFEKMVSDVIEKYISTHGHWDKRSKDELMSIALFPWSKTKEYK